MRNLSNWSCHNIGMFIECNTKSERQETLLNLSCYVNFANGLRMNTRNTQDSSSCLLNQFEIETNFSELCNELTKIINHNVMIWFRLLWIIQWNLINFKIKHLKWDAKEDVVLKKWHLHLLLVFQWTMLLIWYAKI